MSTKTLLLTEWSLVALGTVAMYGVHPLKPVVSLRNADLRYNKAAGDRLGVLS